MKLTGYSKPDHWAIKAQKEGFPARSVYKLKEMDEKFGLLKTGGQLKILDLGAAPGSWSLYVLRKLSVKAKPAAGPGKTSTLVAVDLSPLSREHDHGLFGDQGSGNFTFIQGDFTIPEIRTSIVSRGPYSLILCDAAPSTTGNRSVDTLRSLDLAETALSFAEEAMIKGGNLAVKVFQGGDTGSLLKKIKAQFATGKSFKPEACRTESFETYYLGLGKK